MSQLFITLGMKGDDAKDVINNNFTELYGAIPTPVKLPGEVTNFTKDLPANTMITGISLLALVNNPTIRIGITPNGQEILPDTVTGPSQDLNAQYYCQDATTLYFTFVQGPGAIGARVNVVYNYY